jgi:hypothetical protein
MQIGDGMDDHLITNSIVVWMNKRTWIVSEVDDLGVDAYWPAGWERHFKLKEDAIKQAEDFCKYTKKPLHIYGATYKLLKTVTAKELGR